jgi:hypothetical protein
VVRNIFKTRFLEQKIDVPEAIRLMREEYVSMNIIIQLFYVYTCRANPILGDFVREVYFSKIHKGITNITAEDPKIFIREAIADIRIPTQWSQSTITKVAEHINACLIDFELTEKNKTMKPFRLIDLTANYLAHELHFSGFKDLDILYCKDWELFGLLPNEVAQILERLSYKGTFLFQYSGEILKIGWSYSNMKEFIEHECR